jgi:hypothetical protein
MDLHREILKEHSKDQCNLIVTWVGKSQKRFDELFALFLSGEKLIAQRAAWPVSYCVEAHPLLLQKHFNHLLKYLQMPGLHDAIKRNGIRALQFVNIPDKHKGGVMNCCFTFLMDAKETVAIKVYSMYVLAKQAKDYPEIIPELIYVINDQKQRQTPAFISCANKILKQIASKEIK